MTRRREIFTGMGIEFKLNTEVGRDVQLDDLLSDYDAVFLASGLISQCAAGWKTKTPMACTQRCRSSSPTPNS